MFSNFINLLSTNYLNANYLTAIIAGISSKIYDDIHDNEYLQCFKNETLLEGLKGVQFISTTKLGIEDPLFMIVYYLGNFANFIGDKNSFKNSYEKSLLYSYLSIFFLLDYKKIKQVSLFQYVIIIMFIIGMFLESRIYKSECSAFKLLCRTGSILSILFLLYVFPNACTTLKYLWVTIMGYFLVSCITQYYSLFIFNKLEYKNNVEEKVEEKVEENVEEKVEEKVEENVEEKVEENVEENVEEKVEEKDKQD